MDRTAEFWEIAEATAHFVKLPKERLEALRSAKVIRPTRHKSEFLKAAHTCARNIDEVFSFLVASRRDYLQPGRSSELQKDRVEEEVALFSKACNQQITLLQEGVDALRSSGAVTSQSVAHRQGVVLILTERLAEATRQFDVLRGARFKAKKDGGGRHRRRPVSHGTVGGREEEGVGVGRPVHTQAVEGLGGAQAAVMARENAALLGELQSMGRQVGGVEQTVAEIAVLNSMFSEQVLRQAEMVEGLYLEAVGASVNAAAGNAHLQSALKMNASTRLYILLVFAIAIFGMLFLDRYSSRFGPV